MAKRGRPKKNIPLRDKGTPEQQIRRLTLVNGGDPTLSTTPLDIMYARQIIEPEQYNAGLTYWYLYTKVFGKPFPESNTGKLLSPIKGRSIEDGEKRKYVHNHIVYTECREYIIKEVGRKSYGLMRDVVVFFEHPAYLRYSKKKMRDSHRKQDFRNALDSVVKFFNHYKKKR